MMSLQIKLDNWFVRNVAILKVILRVVFGVFWFIDGALKFQPRVVEAFPEMVRSAAEGQPSWLGSWFLFWASTTTSNPAFFVYSTGVPGGRHRNLPNPGTLAEVRLHCVLLS